MEGYDDLDSLLRTLVIISAKIEVLESVVFKDFTKEEIEEKFHKALKSNLKEINGE